MRKNTYYSKSELKKRIKYLKSKIALFDYCRKHFPKHAKKLGGLFYNVLKSRAELMEELFDEQRKLRKKMQPKFN